MLLVDAKKLKEVLIPSPVKCLKVIHDILPVLAKERVKELNAFAGNATSMLESKPTTTQEYVDSLTFLDNIQEQIDDREREADIVKQLYDLIDQYTVPTPPEDLAEYQTLKPSMTGVRNAIDKSLAERDSNIDKFCSSLDKDIALLNKDVKKIKQETQDPAILDPEAETEKTITFLKDLCDRVNALIKKSMEYKGFQKNFKVEVAKFEELEEVDAEIRLKQLLWDSLSKWDEALAEWMEALFNELSPETLNAEVMKYVKDVLRLEKGLPPNGVVPILKEKVDNMRVKLPVVTDLRNPSLKQRHWDAIEHVVNHVFQEDEPITLGLLVNIGAFEHSEQIQEVSAQASSENSLEGILRKDLSSSFKEALSPRVLCRHAAISDCLIITFGLKQKKI
eukprot:Seg91.5 transcript_id=Seg91.5/GoldUCD/mRNA.D3Y31 product="Dynein heavy chain 6 axonemal" protein_id=Seg91.5/GoldUCD/D3Y31